MVRIGQQEIYEYFKKQFLAGHTEFLSMRKVSRDLNLDYSNTCKKIVKLYMWGYLEVKVKDRWKREYRIKEEFINDDEEAKSIFGRKS